MGLTFTGFLLDAAADGDDGPRDMFQQLDPAADVEVAPLLPRTGFKTHAFFELCLAALEDALEVLDEGAAVGVFCARPGGEGGGGSGRDGFDVGECCGGGGPEGCAGCGVEDGEGFGGGGFDVVDEEGGGIGGIELHGCW